MKPASQIDLYERSQVISNRYKCFNIEVSFSCIVNMSGPAHTVGMTEVVSRCPVTKDFCSSVSRHFYLNRIVL